MTAPSALQFEQYAEMSLAHRNPMDADVLTLTHALRHPVSPGEVACDGEENTGDRTATFWVVVGRCVAAHQYDDNGWRP